MNIDRENQIVSKYPQFFPDFRGNPTKTCLAWGLEIDNGWADLFEKLCEDISNLNPTDFEFTQVKEKFGGLRAYHIGGNEAVENLIYDAEKKSYTICQVCGADEATSNTTGWIVTLCANCKSH